MADFNVVQFQPSIGSAAREIRRQLDQSYALVAGARALLSDSRHDQVEADRLLDMAEQVLSEKEYIDRIDPPEPDASRQA